MKTPSWSWAEYNRKLVSRGSLTIYLDPALWPEGRRDAGETRGRGRPLVHAEGVILLALTLQQIYRLPLRQTQGLLASVFEQAKVTLPVPIYSTLSRRRSTVTLPPWPGGGSVLAIDSTGLQIGGPGAWFTTVHGHRHRSWRKVHIGMNPRTGEIVAGVVTGLEGGDCQMFPKVLKLARPPRGGTVVADGAYDRQRCYAAARKHDIWLVAPPRHDAKLHRDPAWRDRDLAVARVAVVGRDTWKEETGYHQRSLAESTMWRLKSAFGAGLRSRATSNQDQEALLRLHILNRWATPNALAQKLAA